LARIFFDFRLIRQLTQSRGHADQEQSVLLIFGLANQPLALFGQEAVLRRNIRHALLQKDHSWLTLLIHPKLLKWATDVAESRNSIHDSGCKTESRIDWGAPHPSW
jgi:hypothetical protein